MKKSASRRAKRTKARRQARRDPPESVLDRVAAVYDYAVTYTNRAIVLQNARMGHAVVVDAWERAADAWEVAGDAFEEAGVEDLAYEARVAARYARELNREGHLKRDHLLPDQMQRRIHTPYRT